MVQGFHPNRCLKNRWFVMIPVVPIFLFLQSMELKWRTKSCFSVGDAIFSKAREGRFVDENGSTTHRIHGTGIFTYMNG